MLDKDIAEAYMTPGHPVAFSSPATVARHFGTTREAARKVLESLDTYSLHKEYRRAKRYNPYYVYNRRDLVQADLVDVRALSKDNDGMQHLLVLIDVFSKKLWVLPLPDKSAATVRDALALWLDELLPPGGRRIKVYSSDWGREFQNRLVADLLRSRGVGRQEFATTTSKCAVVERANKSLQLLIYKYLSDRETTRYLDVLQDLVRTYNSRPHRSLGGMSPNEADMPVNEEHVRGIHMQRYAKVVRRKPKYKPGDVVRIRIDSSKQLGQAKRSYNPQSVGEFFMITRVNRRLPIPMYFIRSLDTGEHIQGSFLGSELTLIGEQREWKISKVLKERTHRGRKEYLVRYKHFGPRWDEWLPAENVTRVFGRQQQE